MSTILEALKRNGARLSPTAKLSVKDDTGVKVSRVVIGDTLTLDDVTRHEAIVRGVSASAGGTLVAGDITSDIDHMDATVAVNAHYGQPLSEEDAIECAAVSLLRDETKNEVAEYNRAQSVRREIVIAAARKRFEDRVMADSHVGTDATEVRSGATV